MIIEFIKNKYMSLIYSTAKTEREKELAEILMIKLNSLTYETLAEFTFTLYLIIDRENVSDEFKKLCKEIIDDIANAMIREEIF